ncbi:hypothetical protein [Rhodococcus maanshanensis]|uniref:Uncharacterized protein n=1 Tax=Rhodococcus maanshanensis TaxID=183556 RepID=A0A1H7VVR9_9NOCA|nr:hypothetical protein [Rhodococcus maanshanensis]SEM13341.1 hypothetical protein SAMN05444583_12373 [Rhodococcus maanshanensis]
MRRSAGIVGATIAAVGLIIGTAGVASALPVSIPGTTSHAYVAGVDVEPGSYYSRMTESTRWTCKVVMTPDGDNPPSHNIDFKYQIVDLKVGDRLDSVGCTTWHRQGNPFGSAGSTDFGFLGMFGSVDDVFFGYLPLGS